MSLATGLYEQLITRELAAALDARHRDAVHIEEESHENGALFDVE